NQSIYILNDGFRKRYSDYLSSTENQIQNFMTSYGVVSVGIHRPNFMTDLNEFMIMKGLKDSE
ncbi:MAG: radical SAM protein, partial [Candidatus Pararuminococcus gallinarum]